MKKIFLFLLLIILCIYSLWKISNARSFQFAGELISRVSIADSLIALTFDDGPMPEYTDSVLAVLEQKNVKATFFVTGQETENHLDEAKSIVAAGHELGNHSYSHSPMVLKSFRFIENEIEWTDQAIRAAGYNGEIYFRAPYCKKLFVLPWVLKSNNRISVTWDIEPESYPEIRSNPQKIVKYIEERVQPGSIILLHLMYESRETSRKALPMIIDGLHKRGYKFVTVSELIKEDDLVGV